MTADVTATLDVWDDRLVQAAEILIAARLVLVDALAPLVAASYAALSGAHPGDGEPVVLTYEASWTGDLRRALVEARPGDLRRGVTTVGPHRDDLAVLLGGRDTRTQASQGEQRCMALALRLAGHRLATAHAGVATPPSLGRRLFRARPAAGAGARPRAPRWSGPADDGRAATRRGTGGRGGRRAGPGRVGPAVVTRPDQPPARRRWGPAPGAPDGPRRLAESLGALMAPARGGRGGDGGDGLCPLGRDRRVGARPARHAGPTARRGTGGGRGPARLGDPAPSARSPAPDPDRRAHGRAPRSSGHSGPIRLRGGAKGSENAGMHQSIG